MYDISTHHANRLNGELSSAFVNVAEENANAQDIENSAISDSGIVQQMAQRRSADADVNDAAEEDDGDDSIGVQSEQVLVDTAAPLTLPSRDTPTQQQTGINNRVQINSGYSVIS